jgi:hypothetical protein
VIRRLKTAGFLRCGSGKGSHLLLKHPVTGKEVWDSGPIINDKRRCGDQSAAGRFLAAWRLLRSFLSGACFLSYWARASEDWPDRCRPRAFMQRDPFCQRCADSRRPRRAGAFDRRALRRRV